MLTEKNRKDHLIHKYSSVLPSNLFNSFFYKKEGDIFKKYPALSSSTKLKNSNKTKQAIKETHNNTFEQILSKFQKEICLTQKDKNTFNFLFQTIDIDVKSNIEQKKNDLNETDKEMLQHTKSISNNTVENLKSITEDQKQDQMKSVYFKRKVKQAVKNKNLSDHKTNESTIYKKKINQNKSSLEIPNNNGIYKHSKTVNNISINLNEKFNGIIQKNGNNAINLIEDKFEINQTEKCMDLDEILLLRKELELKNKENLLLKEKIAQLSIKNNVVPIIIGKPNSNQRNNNIDTLKQDILNILFKYSNMNIESNQKESVLSNLISEIKHIIGPI